MRKVLTAIIIAIIVTSVLSCRKQMHFSSDPERDITLSTYVYSEVSSTTILQIILTVPDNS